MVRDTKLYDVLGVPPDANDSQIKSAYRKGALKYHPDKHRDEAKKTEAEHKFKELSHAYDILGDSQKRSIYDQYGEEGLEQGGGGGGMAAEDLFAQFFGGGGGGGPFGGMFGGGGGGRPQGPPKAKTIAHIHKVSLEDIYKGKTSKLALQKSVICKTCSGVGGKPGSVKTCTGCDGRGVKTITRQMGPMIQRFQTVCPDCGGEGEQIKEKDRCKECHGKKTTIERKVIQIHIDRGVRSGTKIPLYGEGDQQPGAEPGDVIFEIEQKPHDRFKRQDDHLHYEADIDLLTALAGGKLNIEHLDDRWLTIDIIPGEVIAPGTIKVVRGQGMPSPRHHDYGNLYIHFKVKFPSRIGTETEDGISLQPEDIAILEKILPPRVEPTPVPVDAMTEDMVLEEFDQTREGRSMNAMDEDDDEMGGGGERVQCASQ